MYYQKIITIIIFFFRKDILDSLFDGYDAWISPSFDKSKSPPTHTHTHNPRKNDYISIIVPVSCTLLVYKIHNVKSREQTFLLSKEWLYLFSTKCFQKLFLIY